MVFDLPIPTDEEKHALSLQLVLLYLEKSDISDMSPSDFAKKYFEVKDEIHDVVADKERL